MPHVVDIIRVALDSDFLCHLPRLFGRRMNSLPNAVRRTARGAGPNVPSRRRHRRDPAGSAVLSCPASARSARSRVAALGMPGDYNLFFT